MVGRCRLAEEEEVEEVEEEEEEEEEEAEEEAGGGNMGPVSSSEELSSDILWRERRTLQGAKLGTKTLSTKPKTQHFTTASFDLCVTA